MTASMTLVERLRASAFGADDPAKYIPRGISAADCIKAADAIETAEKALEEIREKASGAGYDPMQAVMEMDDVAKSALAKLRDNR